MKTGPGDETLSVRKLNQGRNHDRLEKRTRNGSKTAPGTVRKGERERYENRTGIEITVLNNNNKAVVASWKEGQERLIEAGFDDSAANELAHNFPLDRILRQLEAFPNRKAASNPLGLLRRAIEEDWSSPAPKPAEIKISHPARVPFGTTVPEVLDSAYMAFVNNEASRVTVERPELRGEFEAEEEKLRAMLASTNFITEDLRPQMLSSFDSVRSKDKRWEEFLVKKRLIMPFPQWRRKAVNS